MRIWSHLSRIEASICESGSPTPTSCRKEWNNLKVSLMKFQAGLSRNARFKRKMKPTQVLCLRQRTTSKLKVLGVGWDREKDLLLLDLTSPLESDNTCPVTKRVILGTTSKLYDPLGLLSPVIILLKIIFQSICKTRVGWDDPVDSFIHEQWLKLVQDA